MHRLDGIFPQRSIPYRSWMPSGALRRPLRRHFGVIFGSFLINLMLCDGGPARAIDFDSQILPILTKAGCNSGACHGAAAGRGGFRLSLYGQRPSDDYHAIVTHLRGRRLDLSDPEASLLIRKGAEFIAHEGGQRIVPDSEHYRMLVHWIQAEAPRASDSGVAFDEIEVRPQTLVVSSGIGSMGKLVVHGKRGGRSEKLPNSLAIFTSLDEGAVTIDPDGTFSVRRYGRHGVLVRVRDQVGAAEIIVPWPKLSEAVSSNQTAENGSLHLSAQDAVSAKTSPSQGSLDRFIDEQHRFLGLSAGGSANEQTLFRRVTLDITGRIPTLAQWDEYQQSPPQDRYATWVQRLVDSDEAAEYWGYFLAQHLELSQLVLRNQAEIANQYRDLLHRAATNSIPVPELFATLVLASEEEEVPGADGFYRMGRDGREQAELFARQFLGVRLQCANCHDHPLDRWTQDDYHGLASLFAGLRKGATIRFQRGSPYIHPRDGQPIEGKIPGGPVIDSNVDPRPLLAQWIRGDGRSAILRNWANRVWSHFLGRGLVEPLDDFRKTNPATNEALLNQLVAFWESVDGEWRPFVREIVLSKAYRRQLWHQGNEPLDAPARDAFAGTIDPQLAEKLLLGRSVRRLPAEVLLDTWHDLLKGPSTKMHADTNDRPQRTTQIASPPRSIRTVHLPSEPFPIDQAKRCDTSIANCIPALEDSLRGRLALLAGPTVNQLVMHSDGQLQKLVQQNEDDLPTLIRTAFLIAWTHEATDEEVDFWVNQIGHDDHPREAIEDFLWSLVTSTRVVYIE